MRAAGQRSAPAAPPAAPLPRAPTSQLVPMGAAVVCDRLSSAPDNDLVEQCHAAVRGHYIDRLAAAACDRIPSPSWTLACMMAILDLRLSKAEVTSCAELSPRSIGYCLAGTSWCAARSGTPRARPNATT